MPKRGRSSSFSAFAPAAALKARKMGKPFKPSMFRKRSLSFAPEIKFFDTALSFTIDATAEVPATGQLSLIPQGDTQSTRGGRKCVVTSINVKGNFVMVPAGAAVSAETVYLYLIQDKQCNGAAATVSGDTGIFTSANLSTANMNLSNSSRFVILKKWVVPLMATAGVTTAYNNSICPFDFYRKCNIPLEYDGAATTGAIGTIRSNNIFLVAGTSGITDDLVTVAGVARLRFADA